MAFLSSHTSVAGGIGSWLLGHALAIVEDSPALLLDDPTVSSLLQAVLLLTRETILTALQRCAAAVAKGPDSAYRRALHSPTIVELREPGTGKFHAVSANLCLACAHEAVASWAATVAAAAQTSAVQDTTFTEPIQGRLVHALARALATCIASAAARDPAPFTVVSSGRTLAESGMTLTALPSGMLQVRLPLAPALPASEAEPSAAGAATGAGVRVLAAGLARDYAVACAARIQTRNHANRGSTGSLTSLAAVDAAAKRARKLDASRVVHFPAAVFSGAGTEEGSLAIDLDVCVRVKLPVSADRVATLISAAAPTVALGPRAPAPAPASGPAAVSASSSSAGDATAEPPASHAIPTLATPASTSVSGPVETPAPVPAPAPTAPLFAFASVGTFHSCFPRKFATPRQGSLAPHSRGLITLAPGVDVSAWEGLVEGYSHVWVVFVFDCNAPRSDTRRANAPSTTDTVATAAGNADPSAPTVKMMTAMRTKVKPPKLGGGACGIFASRAPHRPNPIGLSLVKVLGLVPASGNSTFPNSGRAGGGGLALLVGGVDLVDGTPVLDIKPYHPADCPLPLPSLARVSGSVEGGAQGEGSEGEPEGVKFPGWVRDQYRIPSLWGSAISIASAGTQQEAGGVKGVVATEASSVFITTDALASLLTLTLPSTPSPGADTVASERRPGTRLDFFSLPTDTPGSVLQCIGESLAADPRSRTLFPAGSTVSAAAAGPAGAASKDDGRCCALEGQVDALSFVFVVKDVPTLQQDCEGRDDSEAVSWSTGAPFVDVPFVLRRRSASAAHAGADTCASTSSTRGTVAHFLITSIFLTNASVATAAPRTAAWAETVGRTAVATASRALGGLSLSLDGRPM